ncbi:unnamed protein product [Leptosia nina]|uniref:Uncharacterized protein n=1 Tax=Leptosia nina TaxID=320188 RepID=A0AAV1JL11_9NEOP
MAQVSLELSTKWHLIVQRGLDSVTERLNTHYTVLLKPLETSVVSSVAARCLELITIVIRTACWIMVMVAIIYVPEKQFVQKWNINKIEQIQMEKN